jgi:oligosaccharide translocation protein RFT1
MSLFLQTGIKWLLTEGDRMLILPLASLQEQGIYALAANYGGLVARMIFQPIEISSRNLFANLCASSAQLSTNKGKKDSKSHPKSSQSPSESTTKSKDNDVSTAGTILRDILRAYAILSTICFALGPTIAPLLLRVVAGSRWTDSGAGAVLATYSFYIPFLAINGVSEAFVAATASTKDLRDQTIWMAGFFVLFAASAWLFLSVLKLGAEGFIWANCVNMALRIAFNLSYIKKFFRNNGHVSVKFMLSKLGYLRFQLTPAPQEFSVQDILPNVYAIAATVLALSLPLNALYLGSADTLLRQYGILGELISAGAVAVVFVTAIATLEWKFLDECWKKVR